TVVNNANRITPPGHRGPVDFTGGPNGIAGVDQLSFFGWTLTSVRDYFYCTLVVFALLMSALYFLNDSRTGRAWRALREDPLAALFAFVRPWRRLGGVLGGTVALGFAVHAVAGAVWRLGSGNDLQGGGAIARGLHHWVVIANHQSTIGNSAYAILILCVLA